MPETKLSINANILFPIEQLKEHIQEALKVARDLSPAIITKNNRPAYAIVRLDEAYETVESDILSDQIKTAKDAAKGTITIEPHWWKKL